MEYGNPLVSIQPLPQRSADEDRPMKLYYTPGACSQAPHIALREIGATFDLVKVDLVKHTLPDGPPRATNPRPRM